MDGAYGLVEDIQVLGSRAYFQKIGLNAIDAAATVGRFDELRSNPRTDSGRMGNLLARLFWLKSTRPLLDSRKLAIVEV